MGQERREFERLSVFGGNAEITGVFGRGRKPSDRARIVNWSRGGLLLKVHSPRRKMVFLKQEPVLFEQDAVECVIRLAPAYKSIAVRVEVTHVEKDKKEPDHLLVGVTFDTESTPEQAMTEMAQVLEPRPRSGRLRKVSETQARVSGRLGRAAPTSERVARKSGRVARKSSRTARQSGRVGRGKSARITLDD